MDFGLGVLANTLFSSTLQVFGSVMKQKAAEAQEQEYIKNAQYNAKIARLAGKAEAAQIRKKSRLLEGTNIGAVAGSGLALSGSALDSIMQNVNEYEKDANTALYNANLKADEYMRQGYNNARSVANGISSNIISTITGVAGTIFSGYQTTQQNDRQNRALAAYEEAAKNSMYESFNIRNTKDTLMFGDYYSDLQDDTNIWGFGD